MIKHIAASAVLAALSAAASASGANLVSDGSFEGLNVRNGTWTTVSSMPGWNSTHGIELRNGVAGVAESGRIFAELDTDQNSAIWQNLTLNAGEYTLSFWVQDRAGTVPATDGLTFGVAGLLPTQTIVGGAYHDWTKVTRTFDVASRQTTTLNFAAAGTSDGYGSSLDNVSLTAVPEPSSLVLAASGLALLGLARRRAGRA